MGIFEVLVFGIYLKKSYFVVNGECFGGLWWCFMVMSFEWIWLCVALLRD